MSENCHACACQPSLFPPVAPIPFVAPGVVAGAAAATRESSSFLPGEPIHDLLTRLDRAWETCAGWAPHGPRIRWRRTMAMLAGEGVPLTGPRRPVRDNLFTVPFGYVAPEYEAGFA